MMQATVEFPCQVRDGADSFPQPSPCAIRGYRYPQSGMRQMALWCLQAADSTMPHEPISFFLVKRYLPAAPCWSSRYRSCCHVANPLEHLPQRRQVRPNGADSFRARALDERAFRSATWTRGMGSIEAGHVVFKQSRRHRNCHEQESGNYVNRRSPTGSSSTAVKR